MRGNIRRLHCRYHVVGRTPAAAVAARMDGIARERVPEAWGIALDRALGDDPAVYVLRRLKAPVAISSSDGLTDAAVADLWAARMAGAVLRKIASDDGDGEELVRFADRSAYVAQFIGDLLADNAGGRWFYGAFDHLRGLTREEALRRALLAESEDLPAILGYLHRNGSLDLLLRSLDEATLDLIRTRGEPVAAVADPGSQQPLIHAAMDLVTELLLWARRRPNEADLVAAVAGTRLDADWRDPRSLARDLLDVLEHLARHGYLRSDVTPDATFNAALDHALASLTWLDGAWLRPAIIALAAERRDPAAPARPLAIAATPRQCQLLGDLAATIREVGATLDRAKPRSVRNTLRIHGALVARSPRWGDDPAVDSMIAAVLGSWQAIDGAPDRSAAIQALAAGDFERLLGTLPREPGEASAAALRRVSRLGTPAADILEMLAHGESSAAGEQWIETRCAGVLLLLRTALDLDLQTIATEAAFPTTGLVPPAQALLLAVGLRVGGDVASSAGIIDSALLQFARLDTPVTVGQLERACQEAEPADAAAYQAALFERLVGRRLIGGSVLLVHPIDLPGGRTALVGGDGDVYPFGALDGADPGSVVRPWLQIWRARCDPTAPVGTDDEVLAARLRTSGIPTVTVPAAAGEGLAKALESLGPGALGAPWLDLNVALTSIAVIRAWAHWLRGFSGSTIPYLLDGLLRRRGRIGGQAGTVLVELEPRPLDLVLEMSGYLADGAARGIPGGALVRFRTGRQ